MIFSEVHLLAGKIVPVMAIHSLGGSRANRHHTSNLQPGAVQPIQDGDPQATRNILEYLLALQPRKGQERLTITTIGAGDKHHTPLNDPRSSKPSRSWQTPRVTSKICSETQSPSASKYNHSKQCTWMLSNLTR
jgi:hypothetical protein